MALPAGPPDGLARFSVRLGDDALVMGQRLCEWASYGPTLEEDIALANVALDYLGRARMFYGYGAELLGCSEDDLAFLRDARAFENLLIAELPRGDFAFTMARQYLLDRYEMRYFDMLRGSADEQLAAFAVRIHKAVRYHGRRSAGWMQRLGLGTDESRQRLNRALDELSGYVPELFEMDELESSLLADSVAVDRAALEAGWREEVAAHLHTCDVALPSADWQVSGGRAGIHTEYLGHLLDDLQSLHRAHPGVQW